MSRFAGKNVLITGGTSGIGLATAKRVAGEGAKVIVTGRNPKRLKEAEAEIEGAIALENDAGDAAAAKSLAKTVKEKLGHVDAIFFNAGFGKFAPVGSFDQDHFDSQFHTNVMGPMLQAGELRDLIADNGAVVITGSVAPKLGQAEGPVYAATKGAVRAFGRSLARDLAPRGVRVNVIAPGPIETNFFEGMGLTDEQVAEFSKRIVKMVPLGRFGKSEEVANLAAFLLSDEASYITGNEFYVDGGMTMA